MKFSSTFKFGLLFVAFSCVFVTVSAQKNVAYQDQNVRISVITDGVVRMEYVPDGRFVDDNSFIAVNRDYPAVAFKVQNKGQKVEISTVRFVLIYNKGTGKFTAENLQIASPKGKKTIPFVWKPGMKDEKNLKGTYRTLDGYDGNMHDNEPMPIEDGLLSRSGWTFIDDSEGYIFDHSEWPWVAHRANEGNTQDWYFMVYGHDYKKALKDFTIFSGKMPLPPRYAFGYWWSRYWSYSDNEMRDLVSHFRNYNVPLDVVVVDIDWHYREEGKGGWTGYTWNRRLFPSPKGFLKWLDGEHLQTTFNLHPADGIRNFEEHYPEMAKWMGIDPATKKDIAWQASDKRFMKGWLETQLRPMEKDGVDFWWLDWQQWNNDRLFPKLSNTWWLNYVVFTDMERTYDRRPMLYHRWGGLGNHRYQIGFSGDAIISWRSLDYQPYFNSTASNVLYGFWSHDIGGHQGVSNIDPELYIRWMQFGALSPILRTHSTKNSGLNKEPWVFDYHKVDIIRDIVNERYALAPYIYTMARKAYDEGLSICRPMYYDYPENKEAYDNRNEYMFGDQMLVYPITSPMKDGISKEKVWLPAGNDWYEVSSGTLLKGGQTVERNFHLDEYPLYIKAGSVIPMYGKVKNLQDNDEPVVVSVYPGIKGQFSLYEDNGNDKNYADEYATTELAAQRNGNMLTVSIGARKGAYKGMPSARRFTVKVVASAVPESIIINGKKADFEYDGNNLTLIIGVPETDCSVAKKINIIYPQDALDVADGTIGQFRRIQRNCLAVKRDDAEIIFGEELGTMESTGRAISYYPNRFKEYIKAFRKNYANLPQVLKNNGLSEKRVEKILKATY